KGREAEVDAAFQTVLAQFVWAELKTAKPDVSKILEPTDTALGWKWLGGAAAKFPDPKVKLSADGTAEVKRLATAARDFKLPDGVTRPAPAEYDALVDSFAWAAQTGHT